MLRDCRGNTLSAQNASSVAVLDEATESFARYAGNPVELVDRQLERDPGFVMGHCLKAGVILTTTERSLEPALRQAVEAGEALAAGANDRERRHLAAARAWLDGDYAAAAQRYALLAAEHPRDLLALQVAHLADFYLGRQPGLRDHVAQVLHAWDPSVPGYAHVLGMFAFGLEETGDFPRAEEVGRRAVELDPRDAWASHAVAHVMEMQGRLHEGIGWLEETGRGWEADNAFVFHNWWHLALFHLDRGDPGRALVVYDERIRPRRSDVVLEMVDASALLWRLHLRGHDVGRRFEALAEDWARHAGDAYYAFNDVHALLALLGGGRLDDAQRLVGTVARHAGDTGTNGMMIREVGLPLCRALLAFTCGDHAACAEGILALRDHAMRFGGSNAQRDLLSLTAVEAALRGGLVALARALASERTRLRPTNPAGWAFAARALEAAGEENEAAWARAQAARLRERATYPGLEGFAAAGA
jgi:tetratricopeptide (TPR) repeat protein